MSAAGLWSPAGLQAIADLLRAASDPVHDAAAEHLLRRRAEDAGRERRLPLILPRVEIARTPDNAFTAHVVDPATIADVHWQAGGAGPAATRRVVAKGPAHPDWAATERDDDLRRAFLAHANHRVFAWNQHLEHGREAMAAEPSPRADYGAYLPQQPGATLLHTSPYRLGMSSFAPGLLYAPSDTRPLPVAVRSRTWLLHDERATLAELRRLLGEVGDAQPMSVARALRAARRAPGRTRERLLVHPAQHHPVVDSHLAGQPPPYPPSGDETRVALAATLLTLDATVPPVVANATADTEAWEAAWEGTWAQAADAPARPHASYFAQDDALRLLLVRDSIDAKHPAYQGSTDGFIPAVNPAQTQAQPTHAADWRRVTDAVPEPDTAPEGLFEAVQLPMQRVLDVDAEWPAEVDPLAAMAYAPGGRLLLRRVEDDGSTRVFAAAPPLPADPAALRETLQAIRNDIAPPTIPSPTPPPQYPRAIAYGGEGLFGAEADVTRVVRYDVIPTGDPPTDLVSQHGNYGPDVDAPASDLPVAALRGDGPQPATGLDDVLRVSAGVRFGRRTVAVVAGGGTGTTCLGFDVRGTLGPGHERVVADRVDLLPGGHALRRRAPHGEEYTLVASLLQLRDPLEHRPSVSYVCLAVGPASSPPAVQSPIMDPDLILDTVGYPGLAEVVAGGDGDGDGDYRVHWAALGTDMVVARVLVSAMPSVPVEDAGRVATELGQAIVDAGALVAPPALRSPVAIG